MKGEKGYQTAFSVCILCIYIYKKIKHQDINI